MNLYATYRTNEEMEKTGVMLNYGPGCNIRIARSGGANSRYGKLLGEKLKPYRRQMENGTMDDALAVRLMAEVYAETIILGWEGVEGPDGAPLDFSRENCVKLLLDLPELFRDIQEQAGRLANFRQKELEADAKN